MRVFLASVILALTAVAIACLPVSSEKSISPKEGVKFSARARTQTGYLPTKPRIKLTATRFDGGSVTLEKETIISLNCEMNVTKFLFDLKAEGDLFKVKMTVIGFSGGRKIVTVIEKEFLMTKPEKSQ